MMVGILTHYDVNNQGAQLQMYALYKRLEELGHSPKLLTYRKNYDFNINENFKNQVSIKSIPFFLKNYLIKKGLGLTLHNARKYKVNQKYRLTTFKYENYAIADIDIAVVGSDEVFSLESGVNIMMYGHAVNTDNIISYAPSFGQTDINRIEKCHCRNLISSGLSKIKAISAIDDNTMEMIEKLIGIEPTIVCDPVLLYDFANTHVKFDLPKQKYLIVYAYDRKKRN
ncbi:polysaccharide pyruvyl transferase family protein [Clostridium estertheticum]|uniref:Polysaccharide pyruvyl transferase family protein n=1 Tax=Clostridium estertheticum TaxID=238834 RepID=A0A7Y3WSP3_9CLOT|nr:polysaccharide pyruvyl transferase family protein [Clostridium estertheticum]NNU77322.1 polysaccharide pyruvyl transferase family protein [Clostridium estertheticum]WBL47057.1 polysaccharide pyruvyl transferase family protein [Clostridium estertheticum]